MQTLATIRAVLAKCQFPHTKIFAGGFDDRPYLQISMDTQDARHPRERRASWNGRKWQLSQHMTDSEIVQTALLALITWAEHEVRESFEYRGEAIFAPHFDVDDLVTLIAAERLGEARRPAVRATPRPIHAR